MTQNQVTRIESFRAAAPEDRCSIIFSYEMAMRMARDEDQRRSFRELLDVLWPEYLSGISR